MSDALARLRAEIDDVDDALLALLARRAEIVRGIAAAKRAAGAPSLDPTREQRVLERLVARGAGAFPAEGVRAVWREIMSASVAMQAPVTVAFLGPLGTYSHVAARALFGLGARYVEAATIEGVFDAVRRGASELGVVPLENSTEGAVTTTLDALLDGGARLSREVVIEVSHCLVGRAAGLAEIERVYSHPQALSQCRVWLAQNLGGAQLVHTASTGAAVREAMADARGAAIASALSAEMFGVEVLRERVQDRAENQTRFAVISRDDARRTGDDKTTVAFSLPDEQERGALRRALSAVDECGVNLTRIESRPSRARAWQYVFVIDVEGHRDDAPVARAIERLGALAHGVTVLGSYPRFRAPAPDQAAPT
ncbi:MAG: prephenate dehydratase [Polyangiaceae bacterium]|nr:prephenate dehydratase [Polyangiaceae bacterium]